MISAFLFRLFGYPNEAALIHEHVLVLADNNVLRTRLAVAQAKPSERIYQILMKDYGLDSIGAAEVVVRMELEIKEKVRM
jgi:hypothetical protein